MATDLVVRGGTVVDGSGTRRADVLVRGGRIVAVEEGIAVGGALGADVVDAGGAYVVPGGIDVHTHF
ncbi:MAG: dihydropyrimidinase, partial [Nocardioidaceae bacterium]|nr:dihydropyrimidinase [Nocardioidaceae bacterium]